MLMSTAHTSPSPLLILSRHPEIQDRLLCRTVIAEVINRRTLVPEFPKRQIHDLYHMHFTPAP